ncbi:hypothetical protein ABPG72_017735 [Tetrahymena utriculariae]
MVLFQNTVKYLKMFQQKVLITIFQVRKVQCHSRINFIHQTENEGKQQCLENIRCYKFFASKQELIFQLWQKTQYRQNGVFIKLYKRQNIYTNQQKNFNLKYKIEEIHQIIQVPIQNDSQRQGLETQQELIEYEEDQDKNNMINILKRLQWVLIILMLIEINLI